jgi:zinc transporter 1/2/3
MCVIFVSFFTYFIIVINFILILFLFISGTKKLLLVIYVATFAATTTLGIGIGMALTSGAEVTTPVTVVLEGMAAGTFMYVVFFEVLHRERMSLADAGMYQFVAVVVGLLVMFGLLNVGK